MVLRPCLLSGNLRSGNGTIGLSRWEIQCSARGTKAVSKEADMLISEGREGKEGSAFSLWGFPPQILYSATAMAAITAMDESESPPSNGE